MNKNKTNKTSPFKVESGVTQMPRSKYPFASMKIGDSFFAPNLIASKVRASAGAYAQRFPGFFFSVRKVEGGIRVWRVEAKITK